MDKRSTFRDLKAPFVASLVQERSIDATIANILNSERDGAEGFMVDLSYLEESQRSVEAYASIMHSTKRPIMPLVYRRGAMSSDRMTEDKRAQEILKTVDAGAVSVDIIGNLFEPSASRELACCEDAVEKQKNLISQIHNRGCEVLISSHVDEVLEAVEVFEHLKCQVDRGADIAKIITRCETDEDFLENIRTIQLLKREMKVPFIFLCNGAFGRLQRFIAPVLGSMLSFGVQRFSELSNGFQPQVGAAKIVLDEMTRHLS